jgi:N6-L-threonylcarbamoyladenine synthase
MRPDQTDLVAVTDSPGLAGALLVGIGFGLGLHIGYGMPVTGVNHLEGHVYSALLERPDLSPPFLSLVVSGGHTALYAVRDPGRYECLGKTVDDAAGEAFDKVGKLLGFSYPAGRAVEEEAARARPDGDLKFPIARLSTPGPGFSFSGLKTAVRYFIQSKGAAYVNDHRPQICRAFQEAVVGSLLLNSRIAADRTGIERIAVVGGVACNGRLRRAFGDAFGVNAIFPPPKYCTDNAAMIARAGVECFKRNELRRPSMNPVGRI